MSAPVRARATIHLPGGLIPGGEYMVDGDADYVRNCFAAGFLVRVPSFFDEPEPELAPEPEPHAPDVPAEPDPGPSVPLWATVSDADATKAW